MPPSPTDQPIRPRRPDRLRPGNWLCLLLGTAGGFVAARMALGELDRLGQFIATVRPMISFDPISSCEGAARHMVRVASRWAESVQVFALIFAVGLASAAFRRRPNRSPAPDRPDVGPGRVASAILVASLALASVAVARYQWLSWLREARPSSGPGRVYWIPLVRIAQAWAGWMIASAWTVGRIVRGPRPPEDVIERLGRWLGWAWLISGAIRWSEKLLPP